MIGKTVGSLNTVPAPSAAVLGESLKLLATFGDKKGITTLLEQMREVQAQNEQVFREAQVLMGHLNVARKELEESQNSFAAMKTAEYQNIRQRLEELSQAEARFSGKESRFSNEQAAASSARAEKETALANRERTVASREAKCDEIERDLDSRLAVIGNKEAVLREREQQLQAKEKKLRAVLDGG